MKTTKSIFKLIFTQLFTFINLFLVLFSDKIYFVARGIMQFSNDLMSH